MTFSPLFLVKAYNLRSKGFFLFLRVFVFVRCTIVAKCYGFDAKAFLKIHVFHLCPIFALFRRIVFQRPCWDPFFWFVARHHKAYVLCERNFF